jgi:hypothetical protein
MWSNLCGSVCSSQVLSRNAPKRLRYMLKWIRNALKLTPAKSQRISDKFLTELAGEAYVEYFDTLIGV